MAADCPTCLAVAEGGRIRLTEDTAALLEKLLRQDRREMVGNRRLALDADASPRIWNERLKMIDVTLEEIERTQSEKGWHRGHYQDQSEGTSQLRNQGGKAHRSAV